MEAKVQQSVQSFVKLWCLSACILLAGHTVSADESDRLYNPQRLLDIQIEMPERDWIEVCGQSRNLVASLTIPPVDTPFRYFKASVTIDGTRIDNIAVRKKGFLGSLDSERPSLKLNLDKYTDGVEYCDVDNITLNNCKQDESLLSQWLTYYIYRKAGLPAPRLNLAKVTVNGVYLGIYANVEPIKPAFLDRQFGSREGVLYEGTLADFIGDRIARFECKNRKSNADSRDELRRVADLISRQPLNADELRKVIDLDQFIRFWALESLIGFWDGYCSNQNNFFVYVNPADHRLHFIPWGADVSFSKGFLSFLFKRGSSQSVHARARLPNALYRAADTRRQYFATLRELMDATWNEEDLLAQTGVVESLVSDQLGERQQRSFSTALGDVRRFIKSRRSEIEAELAKGEPAAPKPGTPGSATKIGSAKVQFDIRWNEDFKNKPDQVPAESLKIMIDGKGPLNFESLTATASSFDNRESPNGTRNTPVVKFEGQLVDETPVKLELVTTRKSFRDDNRHPISIQGTLTRGDGFFLFNPPKSHAACGTLQLKEVSMESGGSVRGSIQLKLYKFDWGS